MKLPKLRLAKRRQEQALELDANATASHSSEALRISEQRDQCSLANDEAGLNVKKDAPNDMSSSDLGHYDKTSRLSFPEVLVTKAAKRRGEPTREHEVGEPKLTAATSATTVYSHTSTNTNTSITTTGAVIFEQPASLDCKFSYLPAGLETGSGTSADVKPRSPTVRFAGVTSTMATPATDLDNNENSASNTNDKTNHMNDDDKNNPVTECVETTKEEEEDQQEGKSLEQMEEIQPTLAEMTKKRREEQQNAMKREHQVDECDAVNNPIEGDDSAGDTDSDESDHHSDSKSKLSFHDNSHHSQTSSVNVVEKKKRRFGRRRRKQEADEKSATYDGGETSKSRFSRRLVMDNATSFRRILRERLTRTGTSGAGSSLTDQLDEIPDTMDNDWNNDLVTATTAEANQAIEIFASHSSAQIQLPTVSTPTADADKKEDSTITTADRSIDKKKKKQVDDRQQSGLVPRMPLEMPGGHECNDGTLAFTVPDKWIATKSMDSFCLSSGRSLGFVRAVSSNCAADALLETDRLQVLSKVIALSSPVFRSDGCATVNYSCHFGAGTGVAKFSAKVPNGACVFGLCGPITEQAMINQALEHLTRSVHMVKLPDRPGCSCNDDNSSGGGVPSIRTVDSVEDAQRSQGSTSGDGGMCVIQ